MHMKLPLPSPTCRFETIVNFRAHSCQSPAQPNSYCTTHQYAAHLLEKARYYGCPEIEPPFNKKTGKQQEDGLIIRQGLNNWEAYCEVVSQANAERIGKRLDEMYGKMFKVGRIA